ncbi:unnamed protein product [Phaedon cochleariae]|uniref:Uncharacterized protein n=1 Tax=Phaedon cochleariae TaxID=80249 RepID=A0A9P0DX28_PHACE|nr:unnamed protein product [Phaedon cochleariae]
MDFHSLSQSSSVSVNSYQGEFEDNCLSVNSNKDPLFYEKSATLKNDSGCDLHWEESCDDLSLQSQCSLMNNNKNDLYNLELDMKIDYHDKIDHLLRSNRQLESELNTAKEQIQRLLGDLRFGNTKIDNNYLRLEKKHYDLMLQNSALQFNLSQIQISKSEMDVSSKQLQIDRDNLEIDVSTKNAVITELKQKISSQFVEIHKLTQLSNEKNLLVNQLNCELQQAKNSHEWLKTQLRNCQEDKKSLLSELTNLKSELISQKEKISLLSIDKENILIQWEALQFEKSKDRLTECKMCMNSLIQSEQIHITEKSHDEICLKWCEENLEELRNEISQLKALIVLKDEIFQKIVADNSSATSQCITLQKNLGETNQAMDALKNENFNLKKEMSLVLNREKILAENYEKKKNEVVMLKAVTLRNQKEKEEIEISVNMIRNQLPAFKLKHETMNKDITDKNKQILELQQEKQKLYMEKNWQICELEKIKEKDELIFEMKNEINAQRENIKNYISRIESITTEMQNKDSLYADLHKEKNTLVSENLQQIQRYEMVLQQYKDLLLNSEKKFNDLKKCYTDSTKAVSDLHVEIEALKTELAHKNLMVSEMCKKSGNQFEDIEKKENIIQISNNRKEDLQSNSLKNFGKEENCVKDKEIEKLNILLKVKDLESTEKQKKHEVNTSTLLRKIKEQIAEKKVIEKRYTMELNCLKLVLETIKKEKETIENIIVELQEKLENVSACSKCQEYKKQLNFLEKNVEESKSNYINLKQMYEERKIIIDNVQKENQELSSINSALNTENSNLKYKYQMILTEKAHWSEELSSLQKITDEHAETVKDLRQALEIETLNHSTIKAEKSQLDIKFADLINKNEFISEENQMLEISLKNKNDELISNERCKHLNGLKGQLELQSELQSVISEKFFLQRLNNDLKFALREQVNLNQILKEGVVKQHSFMSLPNIVSDVRKYDENYINSVLEKNKRSFGQGKFSEIHSCLDSMRKDILAIQEDIVEKNKKY